MASREELHADNRRRWDAAAPGWANKEDARELSPIAHLRPDRVLLPIELELLGELRGARACVLGSGDNLVVFALAGLGAQVTSVDISQAQLDVAAARAAQHGLAIDFVRADVCDLGLSDGRFDVVYTGGHVAVWVADLARFYAEATRVLRDGGLLLVNEYHPFRRLWADDPERLVIEHGYFDRGPHTYACAEHLFDQTPGELVGHEFAWTIADYLHAITRAGTRLIRFEELGDEPEGWEGAPMRGLPQHLLIAARKDRGAPPL
jgi:SAM-dependent methyltransferase